MFIFKISAPDGTVWNHPWEGEAMTVGRAGTSDVVVDDRFLSRSHVRIFLAQGVPMIEDLGSSNGTRLNGRRIANPSPLREGDTVEISQTRLDVGSNDERANTLFRSLEELASRSQGVEFSRENRQDLEKLAERLRTVNEVHEALARSVSTEDLLELILDKAFARLEPQEGAILLWDGDDCVRVAARSLSGEPSESLCSSTLRHEVAGRGMAALALDVREDHRFSASESMMISGMHSLVAAPFMAPHEEKSLGMIALSTRDLSNTFDESDLELLATLASVAAIRLQNVHLMEAEAEKRRMEAELVLARQVQEALIPAALPQHPGWEIWAGNLPSQGVSGDFYQVIEKEKRWMLALVDVAGKGMAASLLTASLEALWAKPIRSMEEPEEIFSAVSPLLAARTPPSKYATSFLGSLALETGDLRWANAGHNPSLVIRRDGEVEQLAATGFPLGLFPRGSWVGRETRLAPGDLLVIYSDGVVEAANARDEEFGLERWIDILKKNRTSSATFLAEKVSRLQREFMNGTPYGDDRTLLIIRRAP